MPVSANPSTFTVAVAGNPNSGKTTLFNRLTGLRQKVGNYPGVTVEKKIGVFQRNGTDVHLLDLPGTYGLTPHSEEERIAAEVIQGDQRGTAAIDAVMCVVDSTTLERSLYLVLQTIETGAPVFVALNMMDELERRGAEVDIPTLIKLLGVPVLPLSAVKGRGVTALADFLVKWAHDGVPKRSRVTLPPSTIDSVTNLRLKAKMIVREVLRKKLEVHPWSDKVDRVVMHPTWGPLIFLGVVMTVFQAIFSWAQPFMDFIDTAFSAAGGFAAAQLPEGVFASFVVDGLIAGVGSVVIFLPQILIVFFFIAILENSGYMARAAMVMDRFFNKIGLQGKSFLPLISSYACAVPGIMAARTIENKRDRMATIFVAPFMTCSARLPVYALLISAFVPDRRFLGGFFGLQAATLLFLYLAGFTAAVVTTLILKSTYLRSNRIPFILDIPPYRIPPLQTIALLMWDRARIFLRRAGTIILATVIVLWALITLPIGPDGPPAVKDSYAGRIGQAIEPAIRPLGFDWKIGVGLLAAQAAREVMVSSLATIYSAEGEEGLSDSKLQETLKQDLTPLTAMSLMVFFIFAMQCMSTIAITRKESGGWKVPAAMFAYMNLVAYLSSLAVFQVGRAIGFR